MLKRHINHQLCKASFISAFFCCFNYKMTTKQLNIKNRTYYHYNDLINVLKFEAGNLKLDKKHGKVLIFISLAMLIKSQNGM